MTQDRLRKNRLRKNEEPSAEDGHRVRFTRLEDIPIEESFREKRLLEKGGSYRTLYPKVGPIIVSPDQERSRTVEVYRRCYEESRERLRHKVIRDFIAHFPYLIFDADWLKDLFRSHVAIPEFSYNVSVRATHLSEEWNLC